MQTKYVNLPDDLHTEVIAPCFKNNSQELSNLALTSRTLHHLFQPKRLVDTLLSYVACGNQDAAEKMLKKHPELMSERGSVIDPSGRHFKNISAFELVLWTLDVRYMGRMMLKCLPKNKEGEELREQLVLQYKKVEEKGVTYILENESVTESHFDFSPLINALKTYGEKFANWDVDESKKHWCTLVGKEQTRLPVHVWNHYCDPDESFDPTPKFNKKKLKRNLEFYHYVTEKTQLWTAELIGLGGDFAMLRAYMPLAGTPRFCQITTSNIDLKAIELLWEVRKKDLEWLEMQLTNPEETQESRCTIS